MRVILTAIHPDSALYKQRHKLLWFVFEINREGKEYTERPYKIVKGVFKEGPLRDTQVTIVGCTYKKLEEEEIKTSYIFPLFYTEKEGGEWKIWIYGPIDIRDLKTSGTRRHKVFSRESDSIILVHALAFEDPAAGFGIFPRWDAVNGWTTTIEESKSKWPSGKQGQIDGRKYSQKTGDK